MKRTRTNKAGKLFFALTFFASISSASAQSLLPPGGAPAGAPNTLAGSESITASSNMGEHHETSTDTAPFETSSVFDEFDSVDAEVSMEPEGNTPAQNRKYCMVIYYRELSACDGVTYSPSESESDFRTRCSRVEAPAYAGSPPTSSGVCGVTGATLGYPVCRSTSYIAAARLHDALLHPDLATETPYLRYLRGFYPFLLPRGTPTEDVAALLKSNGCTDRRMSIAVGYWIPLKSIAARAVEATSLEMSAMVYAGSAIFANPSDTVEQMKRLQAKLPDGTKIVVNSQQGFPDLHTPISGQYDSSMICTVTGGASGSVVCQPNWCFFEYSPRCYPQSTDGAAAQPVLCTKTPDPPAQQPNRLACKFCGLQSNPPDGRPIYVWKETDLGMCGELPPEITPRS